MVILDARSKHINSSPGEEPSTAEYQEAELVLGALRCLYAPAATEVSMKRA